MGVLEDLMKLKDKGSKQATDTWDYWTKPYEADTSEAETLLQSEKANADGEKANAEAIKRKREKERAALKKRGEGMNGGGRKGLMFNRSSQGVA